MSSQDKNAARPEEQELNDEALEEVAGGVQNDVIQLGPPPFLPEIDLT